MKKYLIPNEGNFYKANLHCHTTLSDGKQTPEQVKETYKKLGYSIVAYTDHDVFIPHNDLSDDGFLALNGFEMEFADLYDCYYNKTPWDRVKQCHLCLIAKDDKINVQPFYHRTKYTIGNPETRKIVRFDDSIPDFERWYTPNCINYVINEAKRLGFFVTYNHPTWSLEDYSNYANYQGFDALEILNGSSLKLGLPEDDYAVYDDLLRTNHKVSVVASDDNHNKHPIDSPYSDSGVCWTMIKAEKLTYKAITNSLSSGNFYSTEGPEIHELYVEDGLCTVKCSPAQKITLNRASRKHQIKLMENGEPITTATFDVSNEKDGYFRITVVDQSGKQAFTNAYFPEDI